MRWGWRSTNWGTRMMTEPTCDSCGGNLWSVAKTRCQERDNHAMEDFSPRWTTDFKRARKGDAIVFRGGPRRVTHYSPGMNPMWQFVQIRPGAIGNREDGLKRTVPDGERTTCYHSSDLAQMNIRGAWLR